MKQRTSKAVIFDVEGTLIDCVPQTLESWRRTLEEAGHEFTIAELHPYSGMDGSDMLKELLPQAPNEQIERLLEAQGKRYRRDFIRTTRAFAGVHELFRMLTREGYRIAIATTCHKDDLTVYDSLMHAVELADAVVCGDDVKRGKPHPDLFRKALQELSQRDASRAFAVGDTPYDAKGSLAVDLQPLGVLTGGFSRRSLETAGCKGVLCEVNDLMSYLQISYSRERVGG